MPLGEPVPSPHPTPQSPVLQVAWQTLALLTDPEIPVVTLQDMGILREVRELDNGEGNALEVVITPTYSGCPAMDQIRDDITNALARVGVLATVTTRLAPAWTTDWISPDARDKLRAYGIAPPGRATPCTAGRPADTQVLRFVREAAQPQDVPCPRCGSHHTVERSPFGSTACKALYQCLDCQEPFDYFKPI